MRLKVLFSDEDFDRGEVVDAALGTLPDGRIMVRANGPSGGEHRFYYDSIDGFIEDWADPYEEPRGYWYIYGDQILKNDCDGVIENGFREIGNYFESKEEAEQLVEKLKAWRRLRELGLFRWGNLNGVKAACDYRHYVGIERDFEIVFDCGQTLAELNEEWEDAPEEPKEWWYIDIHGPHKVTNNDEYYQQVKAASKEIGNYFESEEEAKRALEKLKAWERLKDKGFRFTNWEFKYVLDGSLVIEARLNFDNDSKIQRDLEICFGGEE